MPRLFYKLEHRLKFMMAERPISPPPPLPLNYLKRISYENLTAENKIESPQDTRDG